MDVGDCALAQHSQAGDDCVGVMPSRCPEKISFAVESAGPSIAMTTCQATSDGLGQVAVYLPTQGYSWHLVDSSGRDIAPSRFLLAPIRGAS